MTQPLNNWGGQQPPFTPPPPPQNPYQYQQQQEQQQAGPQQATLPPLAPPRRFSVNPPNRPFANELLLINLFNRSFVNGKSRHFGLYRTISYFVLAVITIFVLVFVLIGFTVETILNDNQLKQTGTLTQATITNISFDTDKYGSKSYHIAYNFDAPNPNGSGAKSTYYKQDELIDESTYNNFKGHSTITIKYARTNPNISEVPGQAVNEGNTTFQVEINMTILLPVVGGGFYALWYLNQEWQLYLLLEKEGYFIEGILEGTRDVRSRRQRKIIFYVFLINQHGKPTHVRATFRYGRGQNNIVYIPGVRVGLVYLDEKHFKLL